MKNKLIAVLNICMCLGLLLLAVPRGNAYTPGESYKRDLSAWIKDPQRRSYVEMMLDHHVRTNKEVRNALSGGFAAVFLFDGCSDHMNDPELNDLSYYRVSGVCVVLKADGAGKLNMVYFNDNASTIPDRPLEYGAWNIADVGDVGPATVCDGTYQLYSVRHRGVYEALHMRTDYYDALLDAVYMVPEGYVSHRASEINIHTRTSNHTSGQGMWSAGCPLVGDGDSWEFWKLVEATYHSTYDSFEVDNYVGSVTIDRNFLRTEMYTLYKNPDAVDVMLVNTYGVQPETYLEECTQEKQYSKNVRMRLVREAQAMTLPCSNATDARSLEAGTLAQGERLTVVGSIRNSAGNKWNKVEFEGRDGDLHSGYVYSGHLEELGWFERVLDLIFG